MCPTHAVSHACLCRGTHPTPTPPQVRLLLCYSATHLEKLDATREQQWQKVARLTPDDMACVTNLEYLGVPGGWRRRPWARHVLPAA